MKAGSHEHWSQCKLFIHAFTNIIVASFYCAGHKLSWEWEDCGSFLLEWNYLSFLSRSALFYFTQSTF